MCYRLSATVEKYSAARPQLAGRLTEVQVRLAVSADSTAGVQSYAKIERGLAVVEAGLALGNLTLRNGREVAGKTNCRRGQQNYCCSS